MLRYLIKIKTLFLFIFFIVLFLSLTINVIFNLKHTSFVQRIGRDFSHEIIIQKIYYLFPNKIILKDLRLKPKLISQEKVNFFIPSIIIDFSILKSIQEGYLFSKVIKINQPYLDVPVVVSFLKINKKQIQLILDNLPKKDICFKINQARIHPYGSADHKHNLKFNLKFTIIDQQVRGKGFIQKLSVLQQSDKRRIFFPLSLSDKISYHFKGQLLETGGISFDQFILNGKIWHANLWGNVQKQKCHVRGFTFFDNSLESFEEKDISFYQKRIKPIIQKITKNQPTLADRLSENSIYVLDLDTILKFSENAIDIDQLFFTMNQSPVNIKGQITLASEPGLSLTMSVFPTYPGFKFGRSLKQVDIVLNGIFKKQRLKGQTDLNCYFSSEELSNISLEKISARFEDMSFYRDRFRRYILNIGNSVISYWTHGNEHKISLQQLYAQYNQIPDQMQILDLLAKVYDGQLKGKLWIDSQQTPTKIVSNVNLYNINSHRLQELLIHFSKFHGRLFGDIHYKNYPETSFDGRLRISKGYLTNFAFFNWMAKTFNLESVQEIQFDKATATFQINSQKTSLENIDLYSKDIKIKGFFNVNNQSLVSSKLALSFSRDVFEQSSRCRSILSLFNHDIHDIIFDFQLSGDQHAMNFQWMDNQFKSTIQARMPDFIERRIEQRINSKMEKSKNPVLKNIKEDGAPLNK